MQAERGNAAGRVALAVCGLLLMGAELLPMQARQPNVVRAELLLSTNAVHAGSLAKAAVVAQIAPEYHINAHKPTLDYLIPTALDLASTPQISLVSAGYPKGQSRRFAFADTPLAVYENQVVIRATLKVARSTPPGTYAVDGKLSYQACNDHACLPPASVPLSLSLRVVPGSVKLKPAHAEIFGQSGAHTTETK